MKHTQAAAKFKDEVGGRNVYPQATTQQQATMPDSLRADHHGHGFTLDYVLTSRTASPEEK